jgi:hypothetical protein
LLPGGLTGASGQDRADAQNRNHSRHRFTFQKPFS